MSQEKHPQYFTSRREWFGKALTDIYEERRKAKTMREKIKAWSYYTKLAGLIIPVLLSPDWDDEQNNDQTGSCG